MPPGGTTDAARARVVAVVGATATGKTALAIEIARRIDGEIVNADSRQVYRGMDIGTAKPTRADQDAVRHWLIDVVDPDEPFTLARFLDEANGAIREILSGGRTPVVAGGSGQFVWALLEGWRVPRVPPDRRLRAELEALAAARGHSAVMERLRAIDPASAQRIDGRNVRRVIRAIEVTTATGRPFSAWQQRERPSWDSTVLGLRLDRDALYARIDARVDAMMAAGMVAEVQRLNAAGFGCSAAAMNGIGYRQICQHLAGACSIEDAVARIKTETHRLARMQHAWFRSADARIRWLDAATDDLTDRAFAALAASGDDAAPLS
jgi:tRNA dimethylallyltransferase